MYEEWQNFWHEHREEGMAVDIYAAVTYFEDALRGSKYVYTTNLEEALGSGNEIMVNCDACCAFIYNDTGANRDGLIDIRKELGL